MQPLTFDIDPDAAKAIEEKYSIKAYTDIGKMVTESNPDVFDILTPSGVHANNILELIRFERHFVVEKPLALKLDDIDAIIEKCDERRLKIFVVQQNRFNPPVRKIKEALAKGLSENPRHQLPIFSFSFETPILG